MEVKPVTGFAVVDAKDILLTPTIGPTKLSAMVNWLVTERNVMIWAQDSEESITQWFKSHSEKVKARLVTVGIQVLGDA